MKPKTFEVQKVLSGTVNSIGGGVLRLSRIDNPKDADNMAYFEASVFRSIFGITRANASMGKKKLAVVKIQYEDNSPLYRAFEAVLLTGFNSGYIGLSPNTIRLLSPDGNLNPARNPFKVTVEVGTQEDYLKYHPDIIVSTAYNTNQELLKAHDRLDVATDDIRKAQKKLDESSRFSTRLAWVSIVLGIVSVIASWENIVKIGKSVINCIQSLF